MFGVVPRWEGLPVASGWGCKNKDLIGTWVGEPGDSESTNKKVKERERG